METKDTKHPVKLFFVIVGELAKVSWVLSVPFILKSPTTVFFVYFILLIVFAIFQSSISDNFGRRKPLLWAFAFNVLGQSMLLTALLFGKNHCLTPYFMYLGIILSATWANIGVLARSSITDDDDFTHVRWLIPMSFWILSPCWIPWINLNTPSPHSSEHMSLSQEKHWTIIFSVLVAVNIVISLVSLFWVKYNFFDSKDNKIDPQKISLFKKLRQIDRGNFKIKWPKKVLEIFVFELKKTRCYLFKDRLIFFIALLHQTGFQLVFYYLDEHKSFLEQPLLTRNSLFLGFILAIIMQPCFFLNSKISALIGVCVCFLASLVNVLETSTLLFQGGVGFGSGLFLVSFYLLLLKKEQFNVRGTLVGMGDATQTSGELVTSLIYLVSGMVFAKLLHAPLLIMTFGPLILFFLSLIFCLVLVFRKNDG